MPKPRLLRLLLLLLVAGLTSCGNGSSGLDIGSETLVGNLVLAEPGACGGPGHPIAAKPPFSGEVLAASGEKLADLQLGCAYQAGPTGGVPIATSLRAEQVPDRGTQFKLVGSAAPGPLGCTLGPLPERHCLGGDTPGAPCDSHEECGAPGSRTSCEPDARCYATPPIEILANTIPGADATTCVVNVVDADLNGSLDIATGELDWTHAVTTRIFLGPCPTCVAGTCAAGQNVGGACEASSPTATSLDCLPYDAHFYASVPTTFRNTTGESSLSSDAAGNFCEGQTVPGAFGLAEARTIVQRGTPAGDLRDLAPHQLTTVTIGCVPLTRNEAVNRVGRLPYPLSFSAAATLQLQVAPSP